MYFYFLFLFIYLLYGWGAMLSLAASFTLQIVGCPDMFTDSLSKPTVAKSVMFRQGL